MRLPRLNPGFFRDRAAVGAVAVALALLAGAFWLSSSNTRRLVVDADWRQHTFLVIAERRSLLNRLIDASAAERGYLLTGDEVFLSHYEDAQRQVPPVIENLRQLTADNPLQQRRLAALAPAAAAVVDDLSRFVERRRRTASPPSVQSVLVSRQRMDALRGAIATMEGEESRLLARRDATMVSAARRTNLSLLGTMAASIVLLAGAFVILRREIRLRRRGEAATRQLNLRLETAYHELEAFSYSVSHDLRAPLRAVDGFSLALLEDAGDRLTAADQDLLVRMRTAAQRMAALIDDLLRLSRISRTAIVPQEVDLSAVARAAAAELRGSDPDRSVVVQIEDGVLAVGDERMLRVALDNLLGNAWKFTRRRDLAHVEFGVERRAAETVYFIRDDGAGFDMAYAKRLFGAFQRLHSDRDYEGNGIGLATVARVIHLHGGRIWAQSEVDQGATFFFTLSSAAHTQEEAA